MTYTAELVTPDIYLVHSQAVARLQGQASHPNIFADPVLIRAAVDAGVSEGAAKIALVWWRGETRELIAAWPLRQNGMLLDPRFHDYMMLTSPLLHRDHMAQGWQELLDLVEKHDHAGAVHCPYLPEGALFPSLQSVLKARGQNHTVLGREPRGFLFAQDNTERFFADLFSKKARKNLKRQYRDMQDRGAISYEIYAGDRAVAMLPSFLALEASGWKGRRGTAIACSPQDKNFITACFQNLGQEKSFISALLCGGQPLAIGLVLKRHGHFWFWKMTYDETVASLSPGVHYTKALAEHLLREPGFRAADTCAPAGLGHHVAAFNTPVTFYNLLIAARPGRSLVFSLLSAWMKTKLQMRRVAKRLLKGVLG